jgi:hypothetical protein
MLSPTQERIQGLEKEIEAARRAAFSSAFTPSWFVLFKSQAAAMMAASTRIYAHDNRKFQASWPFAWHVALASLSSPRLPHVVSRPAGAPGAWT